MNKIERINLINDLEMQKEKIERKLNNINSNIEFLKESCEHISLNLGYYGFFPNPGDKFRCLICGKGKDEYFYEPEFIVNARDYLEQYEILDKKQEQQKFEHIQTIALGLLKENPNMTRKELVDKLNNLIEESIKYKEKKQAIKLEKKLEKNN